LTAAARDYVAPLAVGTSRPVVDLPLYAEKQETFDAAIGAAIVAAAAGAAVLVHSHGGARGSAVLEALGFTTDLPPQHIGAEVAAKGCAYLDLALYHPPLARLLDLRDELGVRTVVHPVAKLLNPARAPVQLIGVTHPPYLEKAAEAVKMLGGRRALIVRGVEGEPLLSIAAATRLLDVSADRSYPLLLQAKDVGLTMGGMRDMARPAGGPAEEAMLLRRILRNELRGGPRDWVVQNAGFLLYAAGLTPTIAAAVPLAAKTIDSGAAAEKLAEITSAHPEAASGPRTR
jgi:anthranilate phosphoribosyltransferase